jgi:Mrp family chromosome partitioning ATPase
MSKQSKPLRSGDDQTGSRVETDTNLQSKEDEQQIKLERRLGAIRNKVIVLSCKGGVGKSTVAVNLAASLSRAGQQVGLLDVDVHGPSVPSLLNIDGDQVISRGGSIFPVGFENLEVMSIGFMLHSRDNAVIWRGPRKMKMIRQFLADVEWGPLDYLIVDCPPGTGDEPLAVAQLIEDVTGAVIVTTPQDLAVLDVRKSITFCETMKVNVLGVVENMSGFTCPNCGEVVDIFSCGGGEAMAEDMGVPFLGRIPLDPAISRSGDEGIPLSFVGAKSETTNAFARVVDRIQEQIGDRELCRH